jgi:hypothetical protein
MSRSGGFRWASNRDPLSHLLEGQYIGLEEVGDGIWDVYYSHVRLRPDLCVAKSRRSYGYACDFAP